MTSVWNAELMHLLAVDIQPQLRSITVITLPSLLTSEFNITRAIKDKLEKKRAEISKHLPPPIGSPESASQKDEHVKKEDLNKLKARRRSTRRNGVSHTLPR
jgi:hypothetical protein